MCFTFFICTHNSELLDADRFVNVFLKDIMQRSGQDSNQGSSTHDTDVVVTRLLSRHRFFIIMLFSNNGICEIFPILFQSHHNNATTI